MATQGTLIGADVMAKNLKTFENKFLQSVTQGMQKVMEILDEAVTRNISLTDHSLIDLALMGHPYASRSPQRIHVPSYQVHIQSGEMLAGKVKGVDDAEEIGGQLITAAWVGILESVEHAKYVVYGTTRMVPRDFLHGSLLEVKEQVLAILRTKLRDAVINFDGERVRL